jgi:hypothetical protein
LEDHFERQTTENSAEPNPTEGGVRVESVSSIGNDQNQPSPVEGLPEIEIKSQEDYAGYTREERRMYPDPADYGKMWNAKNARRDGEMREKRRRAWAASDAARLLRKLGAAYLEYKAYVENAPKAAAQALEFDEANQNIFDLIVDRMRSNVEKAQNAPRCARITAGGRRCRAPRVRGQKYCHMHQALEEARPQKINLPSLDDANGIQVAIAKSAQALVDGTLDQKQASLLACYLRLAVSNVDRLDFEKQEDEQ